MDCAGVIRAMGGSFEQSKAGRTFRASHQCVNLPTFATTRSGSANTGSTTDNISNPWLAFSF